MSDLGIAFYFEDWNENVYSGVLPGDIEMWTDLAKSYCFNQCHAIDTSKRQLAKNSSQRTTDDLKFHGWDSLEQLEQSVPPETNIVYLENAFFLKETNVSCTNLQDFIHPAKPALYVCGPDSMVVDMTKGRENKTWVSVETKIKRGFPDRSPGIWSLLAASAVCYHRFIQRGEELSI